MKRLALGFTLLEALIALVVGGFGLLAVARLQIGMQGESDHARQLSEATLIGQRRIEMLRAYQQLPAADATELAAGEWGYGNVLTGSETVSGINASYTVTWTIRQAQTQTGFATTAPTAALVFKLADVDVRWADRSGGEQSIELNTLIAGVDPAAALGLGIPPEGTPVRRPRNRDLNVPVPALDLQDGTSAFTPPGADANLHLVFDNITGIITKVCQGPGSDFASWDCNALDAYLVSGFIAENTPNLDLNSPIGVTMTLSEGALYQCFDDSHRAVKSYPGFIAYTCVVIGVDHDGDLSTPKRWSGRVDLTLNDSATGAWLGGAPSQNRVCRYSANYDGSVDSNNQPIIENYEHPAFYLHVTESLENQNFIIVRGSTSCPSGTGLTTTVQHQP